MIHTSTFLNWPDKANVSVGRILATLLLVAAVFVGIGQIPLFLALLEKVSSGEIANLSQANMAEALGQNYLLVLLLIPFVLCFTALLFAFKYIHRSTILAFFTSRNKIDWRRIGLSFCLWGILMLGIQGYMVAFGETMQWNFSSDTFFELLLISLFIIPIQTTTEELLFRSYLFKLFSQLNRPIFRVLLCGLLFGLMHAANPEIDVLGPWALVFYIWTGIFLGILVHLDNGLELAIGYHAVNNIFAAVVVTNDWQAFQTGALWKDMSPPHLGWEIGITMFLCQPFLLFIFSKCYNWKMASLWTVEPSIKL